MTTQPDAEHRPPDVQADSPPVMKNPMGLLALELVGAANAAHDLGGAFERIAKLLVEATAMAK